MSRILMLIGITLITPGTDAQDDNISQLLDKCAANLNRLSSWRLQCEVASERQAGDRRDPNTITRFHLGFDGARVFNRSWLWIDPNVAREDLEEAEANYMGIVWDGKTYWKYHRPPGDASATVYIDDFAAVDSQTKEYETRALQCRHEASFATGYCPGSFERIDSLLREALSIAIRSEREEVNGIPCFVIDAKTQCGDLTVWIDPDHDYAIAKRQIRASRTAGHLRYGKKTTFETFCETYDILRFENFDGIWIGTEAIRHRQYRYGDELEVDRAHTRITEFAPNPDHEALGSFDEDDVPNGTMVIVVPVTHIRYVWQDGELIKHVDDDVVARIDGILETMTPTEGENDLVTPSAQAQSEGAGVLVKEPNEALPLVRQLNPWLEPRAHCGLYCIYSFLRLRGLDPDFRDLVAPEYFGRLRGSSMAELNQAAHDYGFHAGVGARLSTRVLRQSPHEAILHTKAEPEARDYDHYALYLGTERGKAKVFSPPEPPRLIPFSELAPLWDGYALFLSDRPFDIDAIFRPDRERLFFWGMVAVLIVLAAYVGRRLWLTLIGVIPRRWQLSLTVGQGAVLGLTALLCGGLYHFVHDEGLLTNMAATTSLQKAYAASFIPRISARKTRRLLGSDAIIVDTRITPDYEKGHLEGAINLPVDANDALWRDTVASIPARRPIITYCQSRTCKFAEEVSARLIEDGYSDISIFKGGWAEWVEKYGKPEAHDKEVDGEDEAYDEPI